MSSAKKRKINQINLDEISSDESSTVTPKENVQLHLSSDSIRDSDINANTSISTIDDNSTINDSNASNDSFSSIQSNASSSSSSRILKARCWQYFEKKTKDHATCIICKTIIALNGNTTNAWQHLERNHHDKYLLSRNIKPDPKLTSFGININNTKIKSSTEIEAEIVKFIVADLQPISIVEDMGFRNFLKFAFPDYKPPCRQTIMSKIEKI